MTDLVPLIATHLAANGIGVWKTNGKYLTTDLAIVDSTPPQAPENAITLTQYVVQDDGALSDSTTGIQIRARTAGRDPRTTKQLLQQVFNLLHGATHLDLDGTHIVQILRMSGSNLGPDSNGRHEAADNYYLQHTTPTPNRAD